MTNVWLHIALARGQVAPDFDTALDRTNKTMELVQILDLQNTTQL